jgi:GNAT acetyltransferase-like protein
MRRAFGAALPTDEELALSREITEFDRTLAFFDGKEMVATAGIFSYEMTVPGGALPCGGVTRVSVLSTIAGADC